MSDHPSTIEGALKWADVSRECFETDPPDMDSIALQTLADSYRSELKANECEIKYGIILERQYNELFEYYSKPGYQRGETRIDLLHRHESERKALKEGSNGN